ncbi:divergent CRAL/TRIO domain-containing protein [Phthorimaea operculella]|nr:divergent CRAL/TRIO domain-containing protein [Phthorimaea operculella]
MISWFYWNRLSKFSYSNCDRSLYEALLEPHTGRVALRPTQPRTEIRTELRASPDNRRKIQLPPEDDQCSLDSVSVSMESEEEPPEPEPEPDFEDAQSQVVNDKLPSDEDVKRSKSTNTCSECSASDPIPEYSAAEEFHNERSYISVDTGGTHATCDMKVIEPYKRVLSHGGYDSQGSAIIVFSACYLPDTARTDYRYVMDNLFLYVMWTLERLIGEEYVLVYLHGSAGSRKLPSCRWLHECYRLIDRRLRKSLKHLYLVHPTFWLKSFVILTKPFPLSSLVHKTKRRLRIERKACIKMMSGAVKCGIALFMLCADNWIDPPDPVSLDMTTNATKPLRVGQDITFTCTATNLASYATLSFFRIVGNTEAREHSGYSGFNYTITLTEDDNGSEWYCGTLFDRTVQKSAGARNEFYFVSSNKFPIRIRGVAKRAQPPRGSVGQMVNLKMVPGVNKFNVSDKVSWLCEGQNIGRGYVEMKQGKGNIERNIYVGYQLNGGYRWINQTFSPADDDSYIYCSVYIFEWEGIGYFVKGPRTYLKFQT